MNRPALLLLSTLVIALVSASLTACGGGDEPLCDHPFVGPLNGPDQSAQAHCAATAASNVPHD